MSDNTKDKEEISRMIQDQMFRKCSTEVQFDPTQSSGSSEYMNWRSSEYRNQKRKLSEASLQSAAMAHRYFMSLHRYYHQPPDDSSPVTSWRSQPNGDNSWRSHPDNLESTSKTTKAHENQKKTTKRPAGIPKKGKKKGQRVDSQGFTMIGRKRKVLPTSSSGSRLCPTNNNKFSILDTD